MYIIDICTHDNTRKQTQSDLKVKDV